LSLAAGRSRRDNNWADGSPGQ